MIKWNSTLATPISMTFRGCIEGLTKFILKEEKGKCELYFKAFQVTIKIESLTHGYKILKELDKLNEK